MKHDTPYIKFKVRKIVWSRHIKNFHVYVQYIFTAILNGCKLPFNVLNNSTLPVKSAEEIRTKKEGFLASKDQKIRYHKYLQKEKQIAEKQKFVIKKHRLKPYHELNDEERKEYAKYMGNLIQQRLEYTEYLSKMISRRTN